MFRIVHDLRSDDSNYVNARFALLDPRIIAECAPFQLLRCHRFSPAVTPWIRLLPMPDSHKGRSDLRELADAVRAPGGGDRRELWFPHPI